LRHFNERIEKIIEKQAHQQQKKKEDRTTLRRGEVGLDITPGNRKNSTH
jgi:hypothetical protein